MGIRTSGGAGGGSSGNSPWTLSGANIVYAQAATATVLGQDDDAAPVAGVLRGQGSRAGTDANVGGASVTIAAGQGTGTGTPSTIVFSAPVVVGAGTGAQTMAARLTISGTSADFTVRLNISAAGSSADPSIEWTATQSGIRFGAGVGNTIIIYNSSEQVSFGNVGEVNLGSTGRLGWSASTVSAVRDLTLTRAGAAALQIGPADSATPVSQSIQAQGSRGGTDVDIGGGNLTIRSGGGTGAGTISNLLLSTPDLGATGSVAQTMNPRITISQNGTLMTNRFQTDLGANVAAANDLTLGLDGNVFTITGNTQINAITTANWQAGSQIVLIFTGTPTVKHNTAGGAGTAVILLAGAVDFGATAEDTLTLVYNGTNWRELARAVI